MLHRSANDQYLQTAVLTASPARLRLMLLDRSVVVVDRILEGRRKNPESLTDEWTLTLRDILGELLSGITRNSDELAVRVADLYVFLLQELTRAEQEPGPERIEAIGRVLRIEQETWRQVCESQAKRSVPAPASPPLGAGAPSSVTAGGAPPVAGSLNLNA